jgi:hypothetical protein
MDISGVARPQGKWPAAVFYPFEHPKPYASEKRKGTVGQNFSFGMNLNQ